MEDFHIISGADKEEKRKRSYIKYAPFFVIVLLAGIVTRNITLLQKQAVEGAHTEVREEESDQKESIRFDTPDTIEPTGISQTTPTLQKQNETPIGTKTIILKSKSEEDGFVADDGMIGTSGLKIGDDSTRAYRGFVSFVLDDFPQGSTIQKAFMRIYQTEVKGNPFGLHGSIVVDHVIYTQRLTADMFGQSAEKELFATIPQSTLPGWKEVDVTKYLRSDLEKARERSQYRLRFENEKSLGKDAENMVYFESASNSELSGQTPQLVVTY